MRYLTRAAAAALLAVGLLATLLIAPANAVARIDPDQNLKIQGICNPGKNNYCPASAFWRRVSVRALAWAKAHPSRADRRPVPFPTKPRSEYSNNFYVVYHVYGYNSANQSKTWKIGITRVNPWRSRAAVGRRNCERDPRFSRCKEVPVAVTQRIDGGYYARLLEASLIKDYQRRFRVCPPGQVKSCS